MYILFPPDFVWVARFASIVLWMIAISAKLTKKKTTVSYFQGFLCKINNQMSHPNSIPVKVGIMSEFLFFKAISKHLN
jgi:hypothetical protein